MIEIDKTVSDKTVYEFYGHAETADVCNGFSALVCTFCECLKREKPDLKFIFERSEGSIRYDGEEHEYEGKPDYSKISYSGTSRFEEFFDIGIDLMGEEFPKSFVYKG